MLTKDQLTSIGIKYLLPVSLVFLLFGCSLWRDFTTYFNTYYNAKTLYEEVELEILAIPSDLFSFKEERLNSKLNESLEKVIEKCSKIMQYETESSFFDNALFMTGKAFYYQQNYSKALRKFTELSGLEDTDLTLDSRLWTGKSQLQLRDFEIAYQLLDEVKAEALAEEREEIFTEAYVAQISYLIYEEEYLTAINQCENFVEVSDSDELKAEIYYELGKLYLELGNLEDAARVFLLVPEFSPTFDIEFSSKLALARIKKEDGQTEESLDLFNEIKNENKFADSLGVVELEIADIYYLGGDIEKAYDHLTYIDTTFVKDKSSGIARYRRAEIYEIDYMQYDTAMIFYGNVLNSLAPKLLKEEAKEKHRVLDKYKLYHTNISEYKRLLSYIEDPGLFVKDSIAYEEYLAERFVRADSIASAKELAKQMLSDPNRTGNTETGVRGGDNRNSNVNEGDWVAVNDPNADDELIMYAPPKPTMSADSTQKLISKEYYDLGNLFFTDLNVPDSAYHYYEKVLTDYPENHHYVKALYAKGTYYSFLEYKTEADSIFQIIYDEYPESSVYEEAARQLGKIKNANESDPAYPLYLSAEEEYYNTEPDSAIVSFMQIYNDHRESPLAPKALYAVGFILENDLQNFDSAAVIYKSLTEDYADSYYAKEVALKLNLYIQAHQPPPDSLGITSEIDSTQALQTEQSSFPGQNNLETANAAADSLAAKVLTPAEDSLRANIVIPDSAAIKRAELLAPRLEKDTAAVRDSTFIEE